jgi:hypothetical protein
MGTGFIKNGRDLGAYLHVDFFFESALGAAPPLEPIYCRIGLRVGGERSRELFLRVGSVVTTDVMS